MKRPAFTLVEVMVVVGIIVLLVAIATPALGPMLASNHESEAVNTLNALLTAAQTAAQFKGSAVGIRIERAFYTNPNGLMSDAQDNPIDPKTQEPVWLDHQQARILGYATARPKSGSAWARRGAFRQDPEGKVYEFPRNAWLAPDYSLDWGAPFLAEANLRYPPLDPESSLPRRVGVPFSLLETFFIVFNEQGELARCELSDRAYVDRTQSGAEIYHPDPSARGLLVYDRKKWEGLPKDSHSERSGFLARQARPVFINRVTGSIVEELPR